MVRHQVGRRKGWRERSGRLSSDPCVAHETCRKKPMGLPEDPSLLKLADVYSARGRLKGRLPRTPLIPSTSISKDLGVDAHLKLECFQRTGSFKPRGALNKLLTLSPEQCPKGVVGVSGGNHAQGLAFAAKTLGMKATICMPATTPQHYLEATRGYGAEIVLCPDIVAAFAEGRRLRDLGMVEAHPFDDPLIAAGQGTVGLEILEDLPDVTTVFVSIGGGGLISGIATALRRQRPHIRVIGVETSGADAMARSLAAGELIDMPAITSIARTLGAPRVSEFTLAHVRGLVEKVVVVDDREAYAALRFILERAKVLVEPAAACCLAAARRMSGSYQLDEKAVILLCGGNASLDDIAGWQARFG